MKRKFELIITNNARIETIKLQSKVYVKNKMDFEGFRSTRITSY